MPAVEASKCVPEQEWEYFMLSLFQCHSGRGAPRSMLRGPIGIAATLIVVSLLLPAAGYDSAEALPIRPIAGVDKAPDLTLVRQRGGKRLRGFRAKNAGAHRPGKHSDEHANNHQNNHTPPGQVGSPGDSRP